MKIRGGFFVHDSNQIHLMPMDKQTIKQVHAYIRYIIQGRGEVN